ncbi:hypothetical protein BH23ACT3_BH23ACT3_11040 [soil metagenome]
MQECSPTVDPGNMLSSVHRPHRLGHDVAVLERVSLGHHLAVGGVVAGCSVLALFGVIGEPNREERFDARHVTVSPAGGDALRIREVIDQDFGSAQRRGLEAYVPVNFGVPTDVTVTSPDAPDDVSTERIGSDLRIRVGDPDVTVNGQNRYVLEYTLPQAQLSSGELALDIVDTQETADTERFDVVVTGMVLDTPLCSVGRAGASGGCELIRDGDVYRAVIEPLEAGQGITIGGTIVEITDPAPVEAPAIPERREPTNRWPLTLAAIPVGLAVAALMHRRSALRGRNEVFAGGAADAAFGTLPPPGAVGIGTTANAAAGDAATVLVTDRRLGELATIEFAPPQGLEPWEGAVLIAEKVDDDSVGAWFSGLAGREAIVFDKVGKKLTIAWGPRRADLDARTEQLLSTVLTSNELVTLGSYNTKFAKLWNDIQRHQDERIRHSGWWKHQPPQSGASLGPGSWVIVVIASSIAFGFGSALLALFGVFSSIPAGLLFTAIVVAVASYVAYQSLRPARSAPGSALALRTESFRRFLDKSEGQHVQWAWERNVLREYTAWAVALGAAEAWSRALAASNVAPQASSMTTPLLVHSMRSSLASATTAPSSSGSGSSGGGGFSGGSVGGGGGGGSRGSW